MANLHNQFLHFEQKISLSSAKKAKLILSRKALEKRIVDYFKMKSNAVPKFYIQGSYKMGTMVLDSDETYDVDLGVYFLVKPTIEPKTLQGYVLDSVKTHTTGGVEHREKCIRVIYKGDFDIDLPIYYMSPNNEHPFLATKNGWIESDPKQLCDWFKTKKNAQLLRLVKYFKAWANFQSKKMPSGIAFTVWVANNYKPNVRDDISFYETAKAIKSSFWWDVTCLNPATPGDDFLAKLDVYQINNFKVAFNQLIKNSEQALNQLYGDTACHIWRQQFGPKFPIMQLI